MRYGVMFTVKGKTEIRKVTIMDFIKARTITFFVEEIEGDEMEDDLKEYMRVHLEKVNTGY
jgi:copper homeostasis protein CutC